MKTTLAAFLLFFGLPALLLARDARQQQRIDYLIQSLSSLQGAIFIRNGSEYDAAAAREHLQRKLNAAGERVTSAEEFIQYCASESSMTHQPYQIRFADGTITTSASYFRNELTKFDQTKH